VKYRPVSRKSVKPLLHRKIECVAREKFVQKPCASIRGAIRCAGSECSENILWDLLEEALENEQVEVFLAKREV
jgi:hypothetical protein